MRAAAAASIQLATLKSRKASLHVRRVQQLSVKPQKVVVIVETLWLSSELLRVKSGGRGNCCAASSLFDLQVDF